MTELYKAFIVMLFSGTSGSLYNYVRAAWNRAKSCMWLTSRRLATSVLLYSVLAENELVFECILICYSKLQALLLLKYSKLEWWC